MMKTFAVCLLSALVPTLAGHGAAAEEPTKVTLALSHPTIGPSEEVFLYAVPKHMGYFRKEGLEVAVQTTASVVVAAQLVQSGSVEFGTTTADIILRMREEGGDLVAIDALKRDPGHTIAVLPDSPIRTLADLRGKSIGSPQWAGMGGIVAVASLAAIGIEPGAYTKVTLMPGPAAAVALRNGQIDALAFWDAIYAAMENAGLQMRYIALPLDLKFASYSLATSDRFIAAHAEAVAGFCRAVNEGLEFTRTSPAAAVRILYEEFPALKPASMDTDTAVRNDAHILQAYIDNVLMNVPEGAKTGRSDPAVWQFAADFNRKAGNLKGTVATKSGYTDRVFEACNDFDRSAVAEAARTYGK